LLVYHIAAVVVGLLPPPGELPSTGAQRSRNALDRTASSLAGIEPRLFEWSAPVRAVTYAYREAGLRQKWDMFAAPKTADQYVRLEYHIFDATSYRETVARELILPAQSDDRIRLRHDFRDKAIINALDAFFLRNDTAGRSVDREAARNDLRPVVRYFGNRFQRDRVRGPQILERTELWYGSAPMPPVGQTLTKELRTARNIVAGKYDEGPVTNISADSHALSPGTEEREADIVWTLEQIARP